MKLRNAASIGLQLTSRLRLRLTKSIFEIQVSDDFGWFFFFSSFCCMVRHCEYAHLLDVRSDLQLQHYYFLIFECRDDGYLL